ncbi:Na(+)-translocating NADH-quinone reductase subunit A [Maridesulfovibrio salexigens]|uniref:Na(+)-translocating NADH-quinone reductase subunit A n=1 Tax=Maridesulfovibrio salexigens (strain ATCC 14822 / DSM 2638 / NCIMB 8403 / VKM B-1763) TaxID=526222 RepID=C6BWF2_MARSD|nr:Na(+)-translocating NADH-quinone reductase subunit A [Maridesulfovibrio salexigens]ACS78396.1 NADH:ubiquinone oxidoreductase, subunit A [Maridesulfovibrio salexigens DSM 2638]
MIKLKKGLDIPISGEPALDIFEEKSPSTVAVLGGDYVGMKPSMAVAEGDTVKLGQPIFADKKIDGVVFTAPGAGKVLAVNRGERRTLQSVVIELDDAAGEVEFPAYDSDKLLGLDREKVVDNLVKSGLWTAFRTRPFSKTPAPESEPRSIFVTAMDTNPLAMDPAPVIWKESDAWLDGLRILTCLNDTINVCVTGGTALPLIQEVKMHMFSGPHPAGLPGTHIHFVDPVGPSKTVWHIGYQDVIAIGKLFTTGRLATERYVALSGPMVNRPRIIKTRLGANLDEMLSGELKDGAVRAISGSVLTGTKAEGPLAFLGRFHNQVSALTEGGESELLGWLAPGCDKFSVKSVFASAFSKKKKRFDMNTLLGGSHRAIFPTGSYEQVMPLDILPTYLVRAMAVMDTDEAQALGCLELDEEDLALLSFVDCGKNDFGLMLREVLTQIEKEG